MNEWVTKKRLSGWLDFVVAAVSLATMAAACVGGAYWLTMDVQKYISVSAIKVLDAVHGERIKVEVARVLHQDFPGKWEMTLRHSRTGETVCTSGLLPQTSWFEYRQFVMEDGERTAVRTPLPDPVYLDWWGGGDGGCAFLLGGPDVAPTLPAGSYVQETRHCVKPYLWLPMKCEGWIPSTFEITERRSE